MTNTKTLKVCFILDCTASMGPWIQAAKTKIVDTLNLIAGDHPSYNIYAAFIGYRDVGDEEKIIRFGFTDDIHKLRENILNIMPEGGDDIPEDVSGAFAVVNEMNWEADVKVAFFITDAPNHGLMYHSADIHDNYPSGCLNVDLREETRMFAYKGIDLTVFRINKSTDIMFDIMKHQYAHINANKFRIINLVNSRQSADSSFGLEVYTSIQHSIAMSQDPINY